MQEGLRPSGDATVRATVTPAATPSLAGLTTLLVGVVTVAALYLAREVLVPIILAVLLGFVLAPMVALLRRLRIGRVPSTILAVLLAFGVILAIFAAIGAQLAQLGTDLPRYQATIHTKIDTVRELTVGRLGDVLKDWSSDLGGRRSGEAAQGSAKSPSSSSSTASSASGGSVTGSNGLPAPATVQGSETQPVPVEVREPQPTPLDIAERLLSPVIGPLTTTGIILVVTIFVLLQREDLRDRLIRLVGSSDLHRTTVAMDDAARRLSKYFLTQLALNTCFGVVVSVGLFVIGVPSPLLWGIAAALLRFIPYVGALVSALLPIALAAAVDPGWAMALWTLALFVVADLVFGQVVEPLIYGHSTGLSPVAVIVAAIFWTWLWGSIGLLLSTPLTLCLVVLGRHIKRLEFLDVLLGDRPALTPVESAYQRMLAGDSDEIAAAAEELLRERSLSSYYDEVVLKGLELAAADEARGVLTPDQTARIVEAVNDLIADFAEIEDRDPAAGEADDGPAALPSAERNLPRRPAPAIRLDPATAAAAGTVLCLAGRGAVDSCAAELMAQLLRKHGLDARVMPHVAASRASLPDFDAGPVLAVCVCALGLSGTPSYLRYLIRRLRQRWPEALTLVGFWGEAADRPIEGDAAQGLGADAAVSSLREAVLVCLDAAVAREGADDRVPAEVEPASA